jgi:LPS export ABC transporter protein LptC
MTSTAIWGLACLLLFVACSQRTEKWMGADTTLLMPTHVAYNLTVHFTDSSATKARLRGAVGRIFEDRMETTLSGGVFVEFYSLKTGKRAATLRSDSAWIDDRTKNMIAIGNVVVVSDSSRTTLTTPRLFWDSATERVSSTERVSIVSPKETIDGVGFESDQGLTMYKIFNVRGVQR